MKQAATAVSRLKQIGLVQQLQNCRGICFFGNKRRSHLSILEGNRFQGFFRDIERFHYRQPQVFREFPDRVPALCRFRGQTVDLYPIAPAAILSLLVLRQRYIQLRPEKRWSRESMRNDRPHPGYGRWHLPSCGASLKAMPAIILPGLSCSGFPDRRILHRLGRFS